ncbi:hypothetical protein CHS0354_014847, partial [Potamilus streckersoni]
MQIGDEIYALRPAEGDVTSSNSFEVAGLPGKRYLLQNMANIGNEHSVEYKDAKTVDDKYFNQIGIDQRLHGQIVTSSGNIAAFDNRVEPSDAINSDRSGGKDKPRSPTEKYYVDVAVLVDASTWNLFHSTVQVSNILKKKAAVKRKIRQFFSHVFNSVNQLYKGIDDPSLSISVTLSAFIIFQ